MGSKDFYSNLPVLESFVQIASKTNYHQVPDDWHVVVADIRNSTPAIEMGLYKQVNLLGAACIMSVLNIAGNTDIPFVFGGDGATLCVPDVLLNASIEALMATRLMALKRFKLDLRVGSVPIPALIEQGQEVRVAKIRVSPNSVQAVFSGGGVDHAEALIKKKLPGASIPAFKAGEVPKADFTGLECRWQDIHSSRGEIVCLIAKSLVRDDTESAALYDELIQEIAEIFGDEETSHPLNLENLRLSLSPTQLIAESTVRAESDSRRDRLLYLVKLNLLVLAGKFLMKFGVRTSQTDWALYKSTLIRNTDSKRFVESYRQVIAATPDQRLALQAYLERKLAEGKLVYGLHISNRALMTCLVFDYSKNHLHFLDGADGGFTLAAKDMKARIRDLQVPADQR